MWPRTDKVTAKFYQTFGDSYGGEENTYVPGEWQDELARYIIYGLGPGSFHTALYENDLLKATQTTHPANTWSAIVAFMKWLSLRAPKGSWGSKANVQAWLALSNEERRKQCEDAGILASAWELLQS